MSEISPLRPFHLSISCAGAFPARTSAQPAREPDWRVRDPACFLKWPESFASYDPASSSWKTSQRSILGGWIPYSQKWPRAGMMRDGECSELTIHWSAHHTAGRGGSVSRGWPTPKTAGSGETPENWKRRAERVKNTPGSHGAPGMPLDVAVIWPTPDAGVFNYAESPESWDQRKQRHRNNGRILSVEVKRWPTASATDYKGSSKSGQRRGQLTEPIEPGSGGRLNPAWVEMLQGFPQGWSLTDGPPLLDHSTHGSHHAPDHERSTTETD